MNSKEQIIQQAEETEIDLVYTSKGHFKSANIWKHLNRILGISVTVISMFTATLSFGNFQQYFIYIGLLSLVVTALGIIYTALNPMEHYYNHQRCGVEYNFLLKKIRMFKSLDVNLKNEKQSVEILNMLVKDKYDLDLDSPTISYFIYLLTKRGINTGETDYNEIEQN